MIASLKNNLKTLKLLLYNRIAVSADNEEKIIENFHKLYYTGESYGKTWSQTFYKGVRLLKCPLDVWVYQQIIFETKPDLIIETGTSAGGSALFMADMCKVFGHGEVVTIDIRDCKYEKDLDKFSGSGIHFIIDSSTSEATYEKVKKLAEGKKSVMVILDSLHEKNHVLKEMEMYGKLVTKGNYMIVEDTNFNGHPIFVPHSNYEGPFEAVEAYFKKYSDFEIDKSREAHLMTFNANGYLKKK